jgi:uncharacterized membrane protein YqgA involved in biofilm formation
MEYLVNHPVHSSILILISQVVFIYLRTLNVIYTSQKRMIPAILTGNGIAIAWLVSIAVGTTSIMNGNIIPIFMFIIGGTIGTYLGIKKEIDKNGKE